MSFVISTINLKGGVGKSTTTMALGEIMAGEFNKRVLIIDLDPQTNITTMLIGEDRWMELNKAGHTLAQLFKDALLEPAKRSFDLDETLQRVPGRRVDLLPSSLDLIEVQDRLGTMSSGRFYAETPTDILRRTIRPILDDYDYVLIDCPPSLGIITLNGLRISNGYVIPTIPDVLSTYGIPQIVSRLAAFASNIGESIEPLGIVACKYREQSTVHRNTIRRLRNGSGDAPLFEAMIPETNALASSAEFRRGRTLRQKYGYGGPFDRYHDLTSEILEAVEG